MNPLAVGGFLIGLVFLMMAILHEPSHMATQKADAYALGFVTYRNAVNAYALAHKTEGTVTTADLALPTGIILHGWKNRIVTEADTLRCYVYGTATADEVQAVTILLRGSAAIGWNSNGVLLHNGPSLPLPPFIPNGNLVSVINLPLPWAQE